MIPTKGATMDVPPPPEPTTAPSRSQQIAEEYARQRSMLYPTSSDTGGATLKKMGLVSGQDQTSGQKSILGNP